MSLYKQRKVTVRIFTSVPVILREPQCGDEANKLKDKTAMIGKRFKAELKTLKAQLASLFINVTNARMRRNVDLSCNMV